MLDGPQAAWRVDALFDDLLPGGRRRHLAVSALAEATFRTDGQGRALPAPRTVLLASTWDVTGARTVFVRDDATGTWSGTVLAQDRPTRDFLPQVRAFGTHQDRGTGADIVFAGDTRGILELAILSEQKSAKIIALLEELRRDSPALKERVDNEGGDVGRRRSTGGVGRNQGNGKAPACRRAGDIG